MIKIEHLMTNGKTLILACDQGLEHGPADFNLQNIDPEYIIDIANKGGYNGLIFQHGLAEKYITNYNKKTPLIIKLNGKTNIPKIEPFSPLNCSVKRAIKLKADAVGYTVYVGSSCEPEIFREFAKVVEEAHDYGIPVIAWMYPRGSAVQNELSTDILAYAARVGLELGADFIKIKYNNDIPGFKWVVKAAGNAKVIVAGGHKLADEEFLKNAKEIMQTGAVGMAVGRNIWQHKTPVKMTKTLKEVIFENKGVKEVLKLLG